MLTALQLCFLVLATCATTAYKLNVPKVLLPYHSSKLITFTLEAITDTPESAEEPCFVWSSSRPEIVSITPIYEKGPRHATDDDGNYLNDGSSNECSSKAIVSAVSKHAQRYTSIILAKESKTDKLIRCDVIVDKINSIRIKHTTTHLYLEDSPESFTVEALDDEGNTFSSIDGLPFEYSIIDDNESQDTKGANKLDSRNILRLSKFIHSEYVVSESIRQLESVGLSGHKILIEGLKTGMANVQSKLIDPNYKETLKTPLVRLLVVANILLEPSYTVFLLPGSTVEYKVFLFKQTSIEKISLPSSQYYFESRNSTAADLLKSYSSTIVGRNIGSTEIVLTDRNMKEDIYTILPPPTALVQVVQPDHLVFSIKNWRSSWILEVGRTYEIMIHVYSEKKQQIFPSDNLNIESIFQALNFRVDFKSKNGSYNVVTGLKKGLTQNKATLIGTFIADDQIDKFKKEYVARGEQDIELLDPIDLNPKLLIFARQVVLPTDFYSANAQKNSYEVKLAATGGSNSYYWQTRNSTIANVNTQGIIRTTATQIGKTSVIVTDTRNMDIQSKSTVHVIDPIDLQIHPCPVETQVGGKLYLNIKMHAILGSNEENGKDSRPVPISDCSRLQFEINIQDESVYRVLAVQSPFSKSGMNKHLMKDACAVIVLDALSVGRTSIKLSTITNSPVISNTNDEFTDSSFVHLNSNDLNIGSYSTLKSHKTQIVLAKDSSIHVHLFDGPLFSSSFNNLNPAISIDSIQPSKYETKVDVSDEAVLKITPTQNENELNRFSYLVKCLKYNTDSDFLTARFSIWHIASDLNNCPVEFNYEIQVRCAQPHSLHLNQLLVNNDESTSELTQSLNKLKWKCPIKLSAHMAMVHSERPLFIQVQVRDSLDNLFDNFTSTSTNLEWKVQDKKLLDKSTSDLSFLEMSIDEEAHGVQLLVKDTIISQKVYYQIFNTKSRDGETKVTARLQANDLEKKFLSSDLTVHFVSDVKIKPEKLTIFNHPSNVVSLSLAKGSGYYHAEIETIKTLISEQMQQQTTGNILKINQISQTSIVVSPLVNNGLTYLHIFDYCVPPALLQQKLLLLKQSDSTMNKQLVQWPASTTSKIQVAGINSIVANYEDDKLEVKRQLKIYVQISDATGTLIKTSYFSLMNLSPKLTVNTETGIQSETLGTIVPASAEEYENSNLKEDEKEFTAIFILNAHRTGVVNIQFEARSDGYVIDSNVASKTGQTIKSHLKEIQIYAPLKVQPKYIELVEGSFYQIVTNGGPLLTDASIIYEIVHSEYDESDTRKDKKIVDMSGNGIVNAVHIGQVRVIAKSVGTKKKQRVYSEDHFVVKVVRLHSVQLQVPLRSIKAGNEMPVYIMANERKLTPLNFASAKNLRYLWKINDKNIGTLRHPMLELSTQKKIDDYTLFDSSFSLRFKALQPGTVKLTIIIEVTDAKNGQKTFLEDNIEVSVFEQAYFTHFTPAYYAFKNPGLAYSNKKHRSAENSILMTPGAQFQVKTNLAKSTYKHNVNYQLAFFGQNEESFLMTKFCNNNTIQINQDGLITTLPLDQSQLKNAKQCIATLLVTVNENQDSTIYPVKQQTLEYTIKVKPIMYSMLRLRKLTKAANNVDELLVLNNVQMQWQLSYYDDLGDMFDVINTNSQYAISRNDLVDFSQLNKNLFVFNAALGSSDEEQSIEKANKRLKFTNAYMSLSLLSNAPENSFLIRTLKPGRFIMELTPSSSYNQFESKDYLGINIDKNAIEGVHDTFLTDNKQIDAKVGDIICLSSNDLISLDFSNDDSDSLDSSEIKTEWNTEPSNIVQFIPNQKEDSMVIGLCTNEGKAMLKKNDFAPIEVSVKEINQIKFFSSSAKHISNVVNDKLEYSSNIIQFQSANSLHSQNCSDSFEKVFNGQNFKEDLIPFKCKANLYTAFGKHELTYLNQLIKTRMIFFNRHWACDVQFTRSSNSLIYDLIESNQEQVIDADNKNSLVDNEPVMVKVTIETKQQNDEEDDEEINQPRKFLYELPFIPAFHVQTKQIQLPIRRSAFYLQNLKSKNFKEFSLNEHFNLIIFSTPQLHSHLTLTTNCPSLIQIKPLSVSRVSSTQQQKAGSVIKITYDIITSNELFDLNDYANVLQEQNGELYVQITNTLTQQVVRVPIKFLFSAGENNFKPAIDTYANMFDSNIEKESWVSSMFSSLLDFTPNQISSYLFLLILALITVLCFLKLRGPLQPSSDQIAINASAAAAAAVAANNICQNRSPGIKETSSFNPYRYFSPSVVPDFRNTSFGDSVVQRRSPQKSPQFSRNQNAPNENIGSPQRLNRGENVRLFSVNSNVPNTSFAGFDQSGRFDDDDFNRGYQSF